MAENDSTQELVVAERVPTEDVRDVPGAENMAIEHGDRFRGWYLFKEFLRRQEAGTGWRDVRYAFSVCRFEARFVIPPRIEFPAGVISYSLAERELGVFRFPRTADGEFATPLSLTREKIEETVKALTEADLANLLKAPKPLVFNAFRIPQHIFEYVDLPDSDVQDLERITTPEHVSALKKEHGEAMSKLLKTVRNKIESGCNYLSILQNVLDRNWSDLSDLSTATDDIIHI